MVFKKPKKPSPIEFERQLPITSEKTTQTGGKETASDEECGGSLWTIESLNNITGACLSAANLLGNRKADRRRTGKWGMGSLARSTTDAIGEVKYENQEGVTISESFTTKGET